MGPEFTKDDVRVSLDPTLESNNDPFGTRSVMLKSNLRSFNNSGPMQLNADSKLDSEAQSKLSKDKGKVET